jgi:hypothetical protein
MVTVVIVILAALIAFCVCIDKEFQYTPILEKINCGDLAFITVFFGLYLNKGRVNNHFCE